MGRHANLDFARWATVVSPDCEGDGRGTSLGVPSLATKGRVARHVVSTSMLFQICVPCTLQKPWVAPAWSLMAKPRSNLACGAARAPAPFWTRNRLFVLTSRGQSTLSDWCWQHRDACLLADRRDLSRLFAWGVQRGDRQEGEGALGRKWDSATCELRASEWNPLRGTCDLLYLLMQRPGPRGQVHVCSKRSQVEKPCP